MAYVNPQLQIDQQQDEKAMANQKAIGNGLIGGLQWTEENRRRAVDEDRAAKLAAKQTSVLDSQIKESQYKEAQRALPWDQRDDFKEKSGIAMIRSQGRTASSRETPAEKKQRELETHQEKLGMNKKAEDEQRVRRANITDFDVADPNVIPTEKDAEIVKKINGAHQAFEQTGKEIQDILKTMGPADYTGLTSKGRLLQQKISNAQIQQKTIKDLGVLNGPDLPLINRTLGDVGSFTTLASLGPEAAAARMGEAISGSRNNLHLEANARGYKHKGAPAAKQTNQNLAPEDSAAIQWAQQNPNDPRASQILQLHGAK